MSKFKIEYKKDSPFFYFKTLYYHNLKNDYRDKINMNLEEFLLYCFLINYYFDLKHNSDELNGIDKFVNKCIIELNTRYVIVTMDLLFVIFGYTPSQIHYRFEKLLSRRKYKSGDTPHPPFRTLLLSNYKNIATEFYITPNLQFANCLFDNLDTFDTLKNRYYF